MSLYPRFYSYLPNRTLSPHSLSLTLSPRRQSLQSPLSPAMVVSQSISWCAFLLYLWFFYLFDVFVLQLSYLFSRLLQWGWVHWMGKEKEMS
ncbi:hypothetical protein L2E82_24652 [Cichorium intybus]|uniref:Uncharacterized protein n=1 Tax=Cichorium intybus TaxID=13427 RepID=A0ACB9E1G6_CICIN|nr:hypothetical protein L2E82_24652 [Cichorium intybus]